MEREMYWYWLCNQDGIFPGMIEKLLGLYDIEDLFKKNADEIMGKIDEAFPKLDKSNKGALVSLLGHRNEGIIMKAFEKMEKAGIRFLCCESKDYPQKFKDIKEFPYSIYVKGNLPREDAVSVGMVGARACSEYGKAMSKKFASTLASNGVQIISGMALGIDAICSSSAIKAKGKTFVVLGCGVDVIYPMENIGLYDSILKNGGGIISEFPLGTPPLPWQFPHRNRLISALSDCLLIMEARRRSGTLTTVSHALDQGKDIFALPGRATDSLSESCNKLISEGAGILTTPDDLMEYIYQTYGGSERGTAINVAAYGEGIFQNRMIDGRISGELIGYGEEEQIVFQALNFSPKSPEQIAEETGKDCVFVVKTLMEFEINGLALQSGVGNYVRQS